MRMAGSGDYSVSPRDRPDWRMLADHLARRAFRPNDRTRNSIFACVCHYVGRTPIRPCRFAIPYGNQSVDLIHHETTRVHMRLGSRFPVRATMHDASAADELVVLWLCRVGKALPILCRWHDNFQCAAVSQDGRRECLVSAIRKTRKPY